METYENKKAYSHMKLRSHTRNEARSPETHAFLDSSEDQCGECFTDAKDIEGLGVHGRRSSSDLLHNTLRIEKALDSDPRHTRSGRMVRHPITGQNLEMAGTDRLNDGTDTSPISQRSESGHVILGAKEGRGI